jgi:hypothetical protein
MNRRPKPRTRPWLGELEPRLALGDLWTGTVNNLWSKSGNWSMGVPNNTTDVILARLQPGKDPVITSTARCGSITTAPSFAGHTLMLQTGDLYVTGLGTVPSAWSVGNLVVQNGSTVHEQGVVNWTGGEWNAQDPSYTKTQLLIDQGATVHVTATVTLSLLTQISSPVSGDSGTLSIEGIGLINFASLVGTITVAAGGAIHLTGTGSILIKSSAGQISNNGGLVTKLSGGESTLPLIVNQGEVDIAAGCTLACQSGPSQGFVNNGTLALYDGAVLACSSGSFQQVTSGTLAPPTTQVVATTSQPNPQATIASKDSITFLEGNIKVGTGPKGISGYGILNCNGAPVQLGGTGAGSLTAYLNVDGKTDHHCGSIQSNSTMTINPDGATNFSILFYCLVQPPISYTYVLLASIGLAGTCTLTCYGPVGPWQPTWNPTNLTIQPKHRGA